MLNKIYDWVDERLDITPIWRDIADHEVPEHVNPAHHFSAFVYCFGGLTFFVTVIQILSGMFLTMYYVPDIKNAWESVYYLQNEVAYRTNCSWYAPLGCQSRNCNDVFTYTQSFLPRCV